MKKPIFILIVLVLLIACQNNKENKQALTIQNNKKTDTLTYQTYGLPPEIYYHEALTSIFAKYGATVDAVAGCEVTDSLLKAVDIHNDSLFAVLAKKYNNITPDAISLEVQTFASRTKSVAESLKKFDKDKAHLLGKDNYPK